MKRWTEDLSSSYTGPSLCLLTKHMRTEVWLWREVAEASFSCFFPLCFFYTRSQREWISLLAFHSLEHWCPEPNLYKEIPHVNMKNLWARDNIDQLPCCLDLQIVSLCFRAETFNMCVKRNLSDYKEKTAPRPRYLLFTPEAQKYCALPPEAKSAHTSLTNSHNKTSCENYIHASSDLKKETTQYDCPSIPQRCSKK